jgi:hypothetical protein
MNLKSLVKVALLTIGVGSVVVTFLVYLFRYIYVDARMPFGYFWATGTALWAVVAIVHAAIRELRSGPHLNAGATLPNPKRIVGFLFNIASIIAVGIWSGVPYTAIGWTWPRPGMLVGVGVVAGVVLELAIYRRFAKTASARRVTISLHGKRGIALLIAEIALTSIAGVLLYGSLLMGVLSLFVPAWVLLPLLGALAFLSLLPRGRAVAVLGSVGVATQLLLFVLTGSILTPLAADFVALALGTLQDFRRRQIGLTPAPAGVPAAPTVSGAAQSIASPAADVLPVTDAHPTSLAAPIKLYLVAGVAGAVVGRLMVSVAVALLVPEVNFAAVLPYYLATGLPLVLVVGGFAGWLAGTQKFSPAAFAAAYLAFMASIGVEMTTAYALKYLGQVQLVPQGLVTYFLLHIALSLAGGVSLTLLFGLIGKLLRRAASASVGVP